MKYILQMTLSGSTMFGLYLAMNFCVGKKISNRIKYLMLKAAVLFYLIPLAALDRYLVDHVDIVRKIFRDDNKVVSFGAEADIMFHVPGRLILSRSLRIQIYIAAVWGIVALGFLIYEGICHLRWVKSVSRLAEVPAAAETEVDLNEIQKKYGVKRRIKVCQSQGGDKQAFTLGCIHPVIFCLGHMNKEEKELVYAHEVVHIKRWDVFWKILMEWVCLIHWFNPFVKWLQKELEFVSEQSCDDEVLKGKGSRERELYASLLLEFVKVKPGRNNWSAALSRENRRLQERAENVTQKKTAKRLGNIISLGIVAAAVIANSLTSLAYGIVQEVDILNEESDSGHWGDTEAIFIQDGATAQDFEEAGIDDWYIPEYDFLYDQEFIDESGNVYPADERDAAVFATCEHQYVSGTYLTHVKDANGGCTVTGYEATRCSLCRDLALLKEIDGILSSRLCKH